CGHACCPGGLATPGGLDRGPGGWRGGYCPDCGGACVSGFPDAPFGLGGFPVGRVDASLAVRDGGLIGRIRVSAWVALGRRHGGGSGVRRRLAPPRPPQRCRRGPRRHECPDRDLGSIPRRVAALVTKAVLLPKETVAPHKGCRNGGHESVAWNPHFP